MSGIGFGEVNVFDTLRGLDIEISAEAERGVQEGIDEMTRSYEQYLAQGLEPGREEEIIEALFLLGDGRYDAQKDVITPWTDSVYAFDMEMTWIEEGYELLLNAVERMSGGAVDIENVNVDIGEDLWNKGWGEFPLRFTMNGEPCEFKLTLNTDWMDLRIIDDLNRELVKRDPEKKLWFTSADGQSLILFYRDRAWAERFQRETGLELSDVMYENPIDRFSSELWDLLGG